jgi:hypothetical protein
LKPAHTNILRDSISQKKKKNGCKWSGGIVNAGTFLRELTQLQLVSDWTRM